MAWLKSLFSRKAGAADAPRDAGTAEGTGKHRNLEGPARSHPPETSADAWFQRGNGHAAQRQWQPALDCYREAARLEPQHAAAHAFIGNVLLQMRDPPAALEAYDRSIAAHPHHAEPHYNRGVVLQQLQQPQAALQSFEAALAIKPAMAEAHCARADILKDLGRSDEAWAAYTASLSANSGFFNAYLRRGMLEQQLGRRAEALASYQQALALRPQHADAHLQMATLLRDAGDWSAALNSFDAAIALEPDHISAHAERGATLALQGKLAEALQAFHAALRLKPDFARALSSRAQVHDRIGNLHDARRDHDRAAALAPDDAAILINRGSFLSDRKDWPQALDSLAAALILNPDSAEAHAHRGVVLQETGHTEAALECYSRALALNPQLSAALNNRGNLFRARRQFTQAADDYQRALALDPQSADAHYNLGQLALLQGDFAIGWPEYEWRGAIREAQSFAARQLPQPAWTGAQSLRGKRIFLHAEQGLGDTIQFSRYAHQVAALGGLVSLEVQAPLRHLLGALQGVAQLTSAGEPIPPADYQCSLMSLPSAFKTTLETIPRETAYLRADSAREAHWQQVLGARTRPRVGLAWSGNPRHSNDGQRSVSLARWLKYLPEGFEYVCVQNGIRDADQQALRDHSEIKVIDADLDDTAALMMALDLVISVDTSLAHLSGALGQKTWILLSYVPDWRWLLDRPDSPWYPTATLYRQPAAGDWESVFSAVEKDLRDTVR